MQSLKRRVIIAYIFFSSVLLNLLLLEDLRILVVYFNFLSLIF